MSHVTEETVVCGHCGTEVKSWARTCPACHATKGVGRVARGRVVGKEHIIRTRLEFVVILIAMVVCIFLDWGVGVAACAIAVAAFLFQARSVLFSNGKEYWFR